MIAIEHQLTDSSAIALEQSTALEHTLGNGSVGVRRGIESRMRAKRSGMEDCIYLGNYVPDGSFVDSYFDQFIRYPVVMPNEWWKNHMWIVGATRSGKTSRGMHPFAAQKIRQNSGRNGPVIIGDLRGDDAMFHGSRLAAEEVGRKFYHFTTVPYLSSYLFLPLDQESLQNLPLYQFCQFVLNCLSLFHGNDYGKGHFSAISRHALLEVFAFKSTRDRSGRRRWQPTEESKSIKTFAQAYERLNAIKDRPEFRDAQQLLAILQDLASILQLNFEHEGKPLPKTAIDNAIKVSDVLTPDAQGRYPVVYFYLRSGTEIVGVSQIMKLFIYSLYVAQVQARDFYKLGRRKHPAPDEIWIGIDEFQLLCDSNAIRNVIEQCAGYGLRLCCAHQDISQLEQSVDLTETMFSNFGNKIFFTARSKELQDRLMALSGEKTVHVASFQVSHDAFRAGKVEPQYALTALNGEWTPITITEQRAPRFDRNTLIEISNHPSRCIYVPPQAGEGVDFGGYAIALEADHHISKENFDYLQSLSWPAPTPETIVAEEIGGSGGSGPMGRAAPKKPTPPKPTKPRKRIVEADPKKATKKPTNGKAQNNGKDES